MNKELLDKILNEEEKLAWQNIQVKLVEHINDLYLSNLNALNESIPSGTKYLEDPTRPQHVTSAPREIIVQITAELSTINENNRLEDISQLFKHYYHIAVPPATDYQDHLMAFIQKFDAEIENYAHKINPKNTE